MTAILTVILLCLLIIAMGLIVFRIAVEMIEDKEFHKIQKKQLEELEIFLKERKENEADITGQNN